MDRQLERLKQLLVSLLSSVNDMVASPGAGGSGAATLVRQLDDVLSDMAISAGDGDAVVHAALAEAARLLFDSPTSVVAYIDHCMSPHNMSSAANDALAPVQSVLNIVGRFVEKVGGRVIAGKYAASVRRVCIAVFNTCSMQKAQFTAQAAALQTLKALYVVGAPRLSDKGGRYTANELQPTECAGVILKGLKRARAGTGATVRGMSYELVGLVARAFPTHVGPALTDILAECNKGLKGQLEQKAPDLGVAEGVLLGLEFLLQLAEDPASGAPITADDVVDASHLYKFVCGGIATHQTGKRYSLCRAGLQVVKNHADFLRRDITANCQSLMRDLLVPLCCHQNRDLRMYGYGATNSVLQVVADDLCGEHRNVGKPGYDEGGQLLRSLLNQLKALLLTTHRHEMSIAISGYGFLALPMRKYLGADQLVSFIHEFCAYCDALFTRTEEQLEENVKYVAYYTASLAQFLLALRGASIPAVLLTSINGILQTALLLFPKQYNFLVMRTATVAAIMKLFVACCLHGAEGVVIPPFARQGILLSMSGSDAVGRGDTPPAEAELQLEMGGLEERTGGASQGALYEEYEQLWSGLLTCTEETVVGWGYPWRAVAYADGDNEAGDDGDEGSAIETTSTGTPLQRVLGVLRHALFSELTSAFHVLDLSVQVVQVQAAPSGGGATHATPRPTATQIPQVTELAVADGQPVPQNPADYSLFLNGTQLFRYLAPLLLHETDSSADGDAAWVVWAQEMTIIITGCFGGRYRWIWRELR